MQIAPDLQDAIQQFREIDVPRIMRGEALPATQNTRKQKMYRITQVVANYYDLDIEDVLSASRSRPLAHARQLAMYLCRQHGRGWSEIGRFFNRDHATALHAVNAVNDRIARGDIVEDIVKINEMVR